MNISVKNTKVHKIESNDPNFNILDEFIIYQRAAIHFSADIPPNYSQILAKCLDEGWIRPVAYVTEREKLFIGLSENNSR